MLSSIYTKSLRERTGGVAIGAISLFLVSAFALWVYVDLDDVILELFETLPEGLMAAVGISATSGASGIVLGEMMNLIAPMVLGGLAISIGTSAIAGEERDGTIGVLLANPRSRTQVLMSKTGAMLSATIVGGLLMWGATVVAVAVAGGSADDLTLGGMALHLIAIGAFFGAVALFLGSWTGNTVLASGFAAGAMIFSFLAAGILPIVEGAENFAKAFPWYYFNSSEPLRNGADAGHLVVLGGLSVVLIGLSVVGVNRRDLRSGGGIASMLEKLLENHPRVAGYVEKVTGKAQTTNIMVKTVSDHQGVATISALAIFYTAIAIGPMFNSISGALTSFSEAIPEALLAIVGSVDLATPAGWYYAEVFSIVVPLAFLAVTIAMGSKALAGEEKSQTMDLLLVNPIKRSKVVVEKFLSIVAMALLLGVATFAGVVGGSLIGGLDMDFGNVAAASAQGVALGVFFGGVALVAGAATGRPRIATYIATGVALISYVLNSFLPISERFAEWARVSPFYYYTDNQPLTNGLNLGYLTLLLSLSVLLVMAAAVLFQRRDIRN